MTDESKPLSENDIAVEQIWGRKFTLTDRHDLPYDFVNRAIATIRERDREIADLKEAISVRRGLMDYVIRWFHGRHETMHKMCLDADRKADELQEASCPEKAARLTEHVKVESAGDGD